MDNIFKGIQLDRNFLKGMSPEGQQEFRKSFIAKLLRVQQALLGNHRSADNKLRFIRRHNGTGVLKNRLGKKRMTMFFKDQILTFLLMSNHDLQMKDIHRFNGREAGMVYYDLQEFIQRLGSYDSQHERYGMSFSEYICQPAKYVLDTDQRAVLDLGRCVLNLSIIGNAGAGKSLIGLEWLIKEFYEQKHSSLYLTMSPNLTYTLGYEFNKVAKEHDWQHLDEQVTVKTTFQFMKEFAKKVRPNIPDRAFLDSNQSWEVFKSFWQKNVDWESFWSRAEMGYEYRNEATTIESAWRNIHGFIKGAIPEETKLDALQLIKPSISRRELHRLFAKEDKGYHTNISDKWIEALYKVFNMYQEYLREHSLLDDNDVARIVIKAKGSRKSGFHSAFIDECQDLTQIQLLAIFSMLKDTQSVRMASDRCQMVQPTYFRESNMRTLANSYKKALGKRIDEDGIRAHVLHYNYRSSKYVIDFQNYLVQVFRDKDILSLKQNELQDIKTPVTARKGLVPIWIRSASGNKQALTNALWNQVNSVDLQLILSRRGTATQQEFGLNGRLIMDVLTCKGMEYSSVLMYNVLTDMYHDRAMAWKYFYVAATRSSDVLIIYDDVSEHDEQVKEIFSEAAEYGLLQECDDIYSKKEDYDGTWLEFITEELSRNTSIQSRLDTASSAMNYGQYELALKIYREYGDDESLVKYCEGKAFEVEKNFERAMICYGSIPMDWDNRGRNKRNSVESLIAHPDVDGAEYIAGKVLAEGNSAIETAYIRECYMKKYGNIDTLHSSLYQAVRKYDFVAEAFNEWIKVFGNSIVENVMQINSLAKSMVERG